MHSAGCALIQPMHAEYCCGFRLITHGRAQVPAVLSFSMNASLVGQAGTPASSLRSVSIPLYGAGHQRMQRPWSLNGTLPPAMAGVYEPPQIQLLCVSGVRPSLSA